MHLFRVYGRIVEVYKYKVDFTEIKQESEEPLHKTLYFPTSEEAQYIADKTNGVVAALDNSDYEWMDGLEVADVPDTYAEAVKIYKMGQDAYERRKAFEESKDNEQLRADLDYVMLMGGL